jgi:hypothetical protein
MGEIVLCPARLGTHHSVLILFLCRHDQSLHRFESALSTLSHINRTFAHLREAYMDLIFFGAVVAFIFLTVCLAYGCDKLASKPGERK